MASHPVVDEDLNNIVCALRDELYQLEGKTVLLSGGAGFLGSYITAAFERLNQRLPRACRVLVIDNYITGSRKNLIGAVKDNNIVFVEHDVRFPLEIQEPLDYVIHAAGIASPAYYRKFPLETIETAVLGTRNFLELCRVKMPKSFLFFSSSEIYGDPDPRFVPTPETYRGNVSSTGPRACYDESKRLAETLCMVYHERFGVPVKIVRPFNVYGPGMKTDDYRVIPAFLTSALQSKPITVFGTGTQTRTFCYITDAVAGFLEVLLCGKNGEVYNVGNDQEEVPMIALARTIAALVSRDAPVRLLEYPESYPPDEPLRRCPDLTKIRAQLGYRPSVDLQTGLARTAVWFRETYATSLGIA